MATRTLSTDFLKFQFQSPVKRDAFGFKCEFPRCRATHFFPPRHLVNTFSLPHFLDALVYRAWPSINLFDSRLSRNKRGSSLFRRLFPLSLLPPLSSPSRKSNRFHIRARTYRLDSSIIRNFHLTRFLISFLTKYFISKELRITRVLYKYNK